jgi:hypothetical protein
MEPTFTDLLERYLAAKKEYDEVYERLKDSYERGYYMADESRHLEEAKEALNSFVARK